MPDMEFLLSWGDDCANGLPVIAPNACRDLPRAGFTMPSFSVWSQSFGPVQMASYHSCIWTRYPAHNRKPLAVWRGSTTGAHHPTTLENYEQIPRFKLHLLTQNHSDILDAKITRFTSQIPDDVRAKIQLTDRMAPEDYNQYSVIIDVDGNGWSDRFGNSLIHYTTPVLKMASNRTAFFEHLYAPDTAFVQFNYTLDDLPRKARQMVDDIQKLATQSRYFKMVRNMQATSQMLMDHLGLAEALAETLLRYRSLAAWEVAGDDDPLISDPWDTDSSGFEEVPMTCCTLARVPAEFATAVTSRLLVKEATTAGGVHQE
ncbi:hypothetical protein PLESTB_001648700 [Pleodorina starrii]|uniref:Glycosyl transferase CAP10 domain-containing protein n=1 Tax=Pleodorina starrii TaxID=330485 RepID=A0A9W6BYP7_9CHLO|nr:hypothetical protein PLESTB_001648700 [Pleodorina starrii]GLC68878.1 hypothetical protein PLESTF_000753400 [Pleodorina starrii]